MSTQRLQHRNGRGWWCPLPSSGIHRWSLDTQMTVFSPFLWSHKLFSEILLWGLSPLSGSPEGEGHDGEFSGKSREEGGISA